MIEISSDSNNDIDVDFTEVWPCAACTFINKPSARKCEICKGTKVDANRLSRPAAKPAGRQNGSRRQSESLERLDPEARSDEVVNAEIVPDEGVLCVSYVHTCLHPMP